MKKKIDLWISMLNKLWKSKMLRTMRFTLFAILISISQVWAANSYSQTTRLSLNLKNTTIRYVLNEIEDNSEFYFIYDASIVDVEKEISVAFKNKKVDEILDGMFEGSNVIYKIDNRQIVLSTLLSGKDSSQERKITGKVQDSSGEPLPGVTVLIKGTSNGTITDINGNFSISDIDAKTILQVSFIGMKTQEVLVGEQFSVNVVLEKDAIGIEEVIAIGYGTKSKATLTGAVSSVSSEILKDKPQPSIVNSLQGAIPGLQITRSGGSIGDENQGIQLRGVTSKNDPGVLVIVDGIPQSFTSALGLSNLNPADVENVVVLKDAQAAIYGARAAGGVILITTKNGKKGKPKFHYTNNFALRVPAKTPEKVDLNQMIEMSVDGWTSDGHTNHKFSKLASEYPYNLDGTVLRGYGPFPDTPDIVLAYTDWWDYIFGSALSQKHDFSVSGATERSNYFLSVGYLKEESMLNYGDNEHKKYFTRAKYKYDVADWLNISANFYLEKKDLVRPSELESSSWGRFYWTMENTWSSQVPFNPDGNTYGFGGGDFRTPRAWLEKNGNENIENYRIRPTFEFTLNPIKDLEIKGQYSLFIDFYDVAWQTKHFSVYSWDNVWLSQNRRPNKNAVGSKYHKHTQQVANLYANYKKKIKKHSFDVMLGASHEETWRRGFEASIEDLITTTLPVLNIGDPDTRYIKEFANDWAINSYFGRFSYNYSNKYFLEATMRYDGSSKFADGHRWGSFPGVSAGWIITEESFMNEVKEVVPYLKFRASYGEMGNQANVGLYDHFALINTGGVYPFGSFASPSRTPSAWVGGMTSETRSWETIKSKNLGIDAYLFDERLGITVDYFIKNTEGLLVGREYPAVLGATPPTVNGGSLEVKGYEVSLTWKDKIDDFRYSVQLNLSDNKAKVTSLEDSQIPGYGWKSFIEGYAPGTLFAYQYDGYIQSEEELEEYKKIEGVPGNLRVGDAKFIDADGDGILEPRIYDPNNPENSGDMRALANNTKRYQYSSVINLGYKNFDFSATLQGIGKWMVTDGEAPLGGGWWRMPEKRYYGKTWTEDNPNSTYPRLTANGGINGWNYRLSDAPYKLYNNRYLRLKSVTLGYTLPKNWVRKAKLDNCRVYFSGFDLFEFQRIPKYSDPERPFVAKFTPFPRSFSMGLDLTF